MMDRYGSSLYQSRPHQETSMLIVTSAVSISDQLRVNAIDTVPRLARLSRRHSDAGCQW